MKKRTIIGIACMILAVLVVFVIGPYVNQASIETVDVIRLSRNVPQGTQITSEHLEVVALPPSAVPAGIVNNINQIQGQYAATQLYAGDFLTPEKMVPDTTSADTILASLEEGQFAISVPVSFAGGLSGKLENGDVIRFYIRSSGANATTFTPDSLQYVKVITTTTGGGIDQDELLVNEDGSYEMPSTITLLVNEEQARDLAHYSGSSLYISLVCRAESENAETFLAQQAQYFIDKAEQETQPNDET